jgi:hypothetical protein
VDQSDFNTLTRLQEHLEAAECDALYRAGRLISSREYDRVSELVEVCRLIDGVFDLHAAKRGRAPPGMKSDFAIDEVLSKIQGQLGERLSQLATEFKYREAPDQVAPADCETLYAAAIAYAAARTALREHRQHWEPRTKVATARLIRKLAREAGARRRSAMRATRPRRPGGGARPRRRVTARRTSARRVRKAPARKSDPEPPGPPLSLRFARTRAWSLLTAAERRQIVALINHGLTPEAKASIDGVFQQSAINRGEHPGVGVLWFGLPFPVRGILVRNAGGLFTVLAFDPDSSFGDDWETRGSA